jgi:hypothetical protein
MKELLGIQSGLLDAVKHVFPGFGAYVIDPHIINDITLRYLKLVKAGEKVVHPNNPLLPRKSEKGIRDSYLLSLNVEEGDSKRI